MPTYSHEPWLEVVNPFPGESISSFLGRFERANVWTTYQIGRVSGLGAVVSRWKKLYLNPFPKREELEALANVVEVSADRLAEMLPPLGKTMKPRPIQLCAACYAESPCHRIEWQFKDAYKCDRHHLRLLLKCTNCKTPFPIPGLWVEGECLRCSLPFATMARRQQRVE
jgi:hypothetical protein